MSISTLPGTEPPTTRRRKQRVAPRGAARIAFAYLLVVVSFGVGALVVAGAVLAGQSCQLEGFGCLGWLIWGALAGAVLASVVLLVLSLRQKMGILFPVVVIALIVLAVAVPGIEPIRIVLGLATPGVAAWLTGPHDRTRGAARTWLLRGAALLVLIGLAPLSLAVGQLRTADYRESLYVKEGVAPLGLSDDSGWDYQAVTEDVVARGFRYELVDARGRQLRVEIRLDKDSDFQPPRNCSSDPGRSTPCEARAQGVFRSEDEQRQHRIVVRGTAVAELTVQAGVFDDSELDRLAISLEPRSAHWLAERDCGICRVLPG